jgi:hypothetical protein
MIVDQMLLDSVICEKVVSNFSGNFASIASAAFASPIPDYFPSPPPSPEPLPPPNKPPVDLPQGGERIPVIALPLVTPLAICFVFCDVVLVWKVFNGLINTICAGFTRRQRQDVSYNDWGLYLGSMTLLTMGALVVVGLPSGIVVSFCSISVRLIRDAFTYGISLP